MTHKSIVFSGTMEKKFLALAVIEGVFPIPESHKSLKESLRVQNATREDISQIQANLFLNPHVKLQIVYEIEFESTIENVFVEMQRQYNEDKEFKDVFLLCSLVMARNPSLTIESIRDHLGEAAEKEEKVIESFGSVPTRQSDGDLLTFEQSIRFAVSRNKRPRATQEQQLLFTEYEKSLEKIWPIKSAYDELKNLYRRANIGDSVVVDPLLKNSFTDFLDEDSLDRGQFEKIDLFYLFIKELRTLPVGRSIKETIELANTREGDALRKRVGELQDSIIAGELSGIESIRKKIRDEIHEYKSLTSQLISPNGLSDLTDITLSATSLIPVVGTFSGAVGLAKTTANISQKRSVYQKIQDSIWVDYRGSTI